MNKLLTVVILLFGLAVPALCLAAFTPSTGGERKTTFTDLPPAAQVKIAATLGRDNPAYHAALVSDGWRLITPHGGVSAYFDTTGARFVSSADDWRVTVTAWGRGDTLNGLAATSPAAEANRVAYRRGDITEWYVNSPVGLEQGLTLARPPSPADGRPLTVTLAIGGSLTAVRDGDGLALRRGGTTVLTYQGLVAFDADGKKLPARLEPRGTSVALVVDDTQARYPVVIDPYIQQAKLISVLGVMSDYFGASVAISDDGSTIVVGAIRTDGISYADSGMAYVFVKGSDWVTAWESARLSASDNAILNYFGMSVAVSNDGSVIAVGAPFANSAKGAAYLFVAPVGGWVTTTSQTAKLTASDGAANNYLGWSVALSGDGSTVVAGAGYATVGGKAAQGAAYLFAKPAGGWASGTQTAKLIASDGAANDTLGNSVAISGDGGTVVVGANGAKVGVNYQQGAAYLFVKPGGEWVSASQTAKLTASDGVPYDGLGFSLALSGDGGTVVAGASNATVGGKSQQGAAYLYLKPAGGWSSAVVQTAKLTASDGAAHDSLGISIAVGSDGGTVVAGANGATVGGKSSQGAAYLFVKPPGGWATTSTFTTKLTAADGAANWRFGTSVALNGTVIVGGGRRRNWGVLRHK